MRICVVGLGKIGLPLAAQYASLGHVVVGCDTNDDVVRIVNSGRATFSGEPELERLIRDATARGLLVASTDTVASVKSSEVVVVVVPLLVDDSGLPKFEPLDSATRSVGSGLSPGTLVCFETTLPVGTTRNRLAGILASESGLIAGEDFYVAFSPERVSSGQVFQDLRQYPKLVGAINNISAEAAMSFYSKVLTFDERPDLERPNGVWDLGSAEAAELAKLAETTYRDVNIALANQFALYSEQAGIDVYAVIQACNSQPFSHIHQPGISVGGHCIPVYPHMYLLGHPDATVVRAAREANRAMPKKSVERLVREFGDLQGKKVAILGLAYRGGVKEHSNSGAWDLVRELERIGAQALVHDPLFSSDELKKLGLTPYDLATPVDVTIIHSNHQMYSNLDATSVELLGLVFDGRKSLGTLGQKQLSNAHLTLGIGNVHA